MNIPTRPMNEPGWQGHWKGVRQRLLRRRSAILGMAIVVFFSLVAILASLLAPHDPVTMGSGKQYYLPPAWVKKSALGRVGDPRYLLGTDTVGRDLLSRLLYGTQASMFISLSAAPIVAALGVSIGLLAGYAGGWVDNLIMRICDVFYAFPSIMLYIMILFMLRRTPLGMWQNGLATLLLALISVGWVGLARLVRAITLVLKNAEFVEAAHSIGASGLHIVWRHILPNCLGAVAVWMTGTIPRMIIVEALLGYIGMSISPATDSSRAFLVTSWGGLFLEGRMAINSHPIMLLAPTVCVALVGVGFTLFGDALRDALDPHVRKMT